MKKEHDKKSLITGVILGAILMIIIVGSGLFLLWNWNGNSFDLSNENQGNVVTTEAKITPNQGIDINQIYIKSVNSVLSVINLQKISTGSSFLDYYLEQQQGTNIQEAGTGSGFVYKKEKGYYYAVTNNHVVNDGDKLEVVLNTTDLEKDQPLEAELVGLDSVYDLAIIKFKSPKDIEPLKFANSDKIFPGEEVIAIGSPYGVDFQGSVTEGIVSAPLRISKDGGGNKLSYIQTDTAINPGNSGGPLLNASGEVIGINSMKISETASDNMGFAIPSNTVVDILNEIETGSMIYDNGLE